MLSRMVETMPRRSDRHRPGPGRRHTGLFVLLAIFVALLLVAAGLAGYYRWSVGASGLRRPVTVVIPTGATGNQVASLLQHDGVIRSSFGFETAARFQGRSLQFQAGSYRLTTNMPVSQVFAALDRGPAVRIVKVTIPEGLTVAQTMAIMGKDLGVPAAALDRNANSGHHFLPPYLPPGKPTTEGFLFPTTYFLQHAEAPEQVVERLLNEFSTEADGLPWKNAKRLGVSPYQVVIIASMIEREARFEADRVRVARVIYNRLARGMPLQIDATVRYALGNWKTPLTYQDLKVKSPYNTYTHTGLPPTPIANPGLASLRAALQPAKGGWLYFIVVDKAGHEAFTSSYSRFLQLKANAPPG